MSDFRSPPPPLARKQSTLELLSPSAYRLLAERRRSGGAAGAASSSASPATSSSADVSVGARLAVTPSIPGSRGLGTSSSPPGALLPRTPGHEEWLEHRKEVNELKASAEFLKADAARRDADLRRQLQRQRDAVASLTAERERERAVAHAKEKQLEARIDDLQRQRRQLLDRLEDTRTDSDDQTGRWRNLAEQRERDLRQATSELRKVTDERDELRVSASRCESELRQRMLEAEKELQQLRQDLVSAQTAASEANAAADAAASASVSAGDASDAAARAELEARLAEAEADRVTLRHCQAELQRLQSEAAATESLRVEVKHLRENARNSHVLREEISDLQQQVQRQRAEIQELEQLRQQHHDASEQLQRWRSYFAGVSDKFSPEDVASTIRDLQHRCVALTNDKAGLEARLEQARRTAASAAGDGDSGHSTHGSRVMDELAQARQQAKAAETQVLALQHQLRFITADRDDLQQLVASYDADTTAAVDAARRAREENMAAQLEESLGIIAMLQTELEEIRDAAAALPRKRVAVSSAAATSVSGSAKQEHCDFGDAGLLRKDNERLNAELERALEQLARLENRLGRGDYNPASCKVMHARDNPVAQLRAARQQQHHTALVQENATLRQQLQRLGAFPVADASADASEAGTGDAASSSGAECADASTLSLQHRIAELDKLVKDGQVRLDRLKVVFRDKITEFREIVYLVTGFRIDLLDGGRYKLRSMYAEREDDELLFIKDEQGALSLLASAFADRLAPGLLDSLARHRSIPVFLAEVTSDLFSRVTRM